MNSTIPSGMVEFISTKQIKVNPVLDIIQYPLSKPKDSGGKVILMKKNGGGKGSARESAPAWGVWGHAPPENF